MLFRSCTKSGSFLKSQLFQLGGQNIAEEISLKSENFSKLSFSISSSNEYSRLNSFRIDSFDLLAVQEALKSLLQHHSSKASILPHSVFLFLTNTKVFLFICVLFLNHKLLEGIGLSPNNSSASEIIPIRNLQKCRA